MVILSEIPVQIILIISGACGIFETFGGISSIHHIGEAVWAGGITIGVGEVVYHAARGMPAAQIGFEVTVEIVGNTSFRVFALIYPGGAYPCTVGSAGETIGIIVREPVQVSGAAGTVDVGIPLYGGNIAVVLYRAAIGRGFVLQSHVEEIENLISTLQDTSGWVIDACEPARRPGGAERSNS